MSWILREEGQKQTKKVLFRSDKSRQNKRQTKRCDDLKEDLQALGVDIWEEMTKKKEE